MKRSVWIFSVAGILLVAVIKAPAANPIITDVFTADPAPMVHDGTVYLYVGQDEALPDQHYVMNR